MCTCVLSKAMYEKVMHLGKETTEKYFENEFQTPEELRRKTEKSVATNQYKRLRKQGEPER